VTSAASRRADAESFMIHSNLPTCRLSHTTN
jgi:hypothetical protein